MTDLFIGAGKGFGEEFMQYRVSNNHDVFNITSKPAASPKVLSIDWKTVKENELHRWLQSLPKIDFILFNQNSSSLSENSFSQNNYGTLELWKQMAHWKQSYYVSCQLPFQIIHTLGDRLHQNSRICWMLSSMVLVHEHDPGVADYIGNKFQNYMIMKNFANQHPSCFFGIDPGNISGIGYSEKIQILEKILSLPDEQLNGKVYCTDGSLSELYGRFS